jgi:hypothetical protein
MELSHRFAGKDWRKVCMAEGAKVMSKETANAMIAACAMRCK